MSVTAQWMASGKCATLRSLDLDSSDNVTEEMLGKFLERYGSQLEGLGLSGMGHVTDTLWNAYLPKLVNARILVRLTLTFVGSTHLSFCSDYGDF